MEVRIEVFSLLPAYISHGMWDIPMRLGSQGSSPSDRINRYKEILEILSLLLIAGCMFF